MSSWHLCLQTSQLLPHKLHATIAVARRFLLKHLPPRATTRQLVRKGSFFPSKTWSPSGCRSVYTDCNSKHLTDVLYSDSFLFSLLSFSIQAFFLLRQHQGQPRLVHLHRPSPTRLPAVASLRSSSSSCSSCRTHLPQTPATHCLNKLPAFPSLIFLFYLPR